MGYNVKQNKDSNGYPVLALMPKPGGTIALSDGNTTANPIGCNVIRVLATGGSPRIRFGDSSVVADSNDLLLVSDLPEYFSINAKDYVAVDGGDISITTFQTGGS